MSNEYKIFHAPPPAEVLRELDKTVDKTDPIIDVPRPPSATHQGRQASFTYRRPRSVDSHKVHGDNGADHAEGHPGPAIQVLLDPRSPRDILI